MEPRRSELFEHRVVAAHAEFPDRNACVSNRSAGAATIPDTRHLNCDGPTNLPRVTPFFMYGREMST